VELQAEPERPIERGREAMKEKGEEFLGSLDETDN